MLLTHLPEDVLKLIARMACTLHVKRAKRSQDYIHRVVMPCLELRQTSRIFRQLAPAQEVREKIFLDLPWARAQFIGNAVACVLGAVTKGMPAAAAQVHTLTKDGLAFHLRLHADTAAVGLLDEKQCVLFVASELTGKVGQVNRRVRLRKMLVLPAVYAVDPAKRTPQQQAGFLKWARSIRFKLATDWRRDFARMHRKAVAHEVRQMFPDVP
jgi:hypothetical protein